MSFPAELKYTKSHEWVKFLNETTVRIGITDHAQKELGDIVFINLPQKGDTLTKGETFADVESVKAVSDVFSPVSGTVKDINEELLDSPEIVNQSAYDAWMVEVEGIADCEDLLTEDEYEALVAKEE